MKKPIQIFLLLLFCLNFVFMLAMHPVFAEEDSNLVVDHNQTIEEPTDNVHFMISKSEIKSGETFTVAVNNYTGIGITSAAIGISYDAARFEVIGSSIFGQEPTAFQKKVKEGRYTLNGVVQDAANPYKDKAIVTFTLLAKENISGTAALQLIESKVGYGAIGEMPMALPIVNNEVSFTVIHDLDTSQPVDAGTDVPEPTDEDETLLPTESTHLEPDPIEGSDKTEPTANSDKTEPTANSDKTEPTANSDKTEPTANSDKTEPTANSDKTEPTANSDKTKNSENAPQNNQGQNSSENANAPQNNQTDRETLKTMLIEIGKGNVNIIDQNAAQSQATVTLRETVQVSRQDETSAPLMALKIETQRTTQTSILPENHSQNTKTKKIEKQEEKQARQEKVFSLTEDDSTLHNVVVVGGLALIGLGSLGALGFMFISGKIKPR